MTKPLSLPTFDSLPNSEEIVQISQWLNEAGLSSLELANAQGTHLRICIETAETPAGSSEQYNALEPSVHNAPAENGVTVIAPYFGHLLLHNPITKEALAPVGSSVCTGAIVAILEIEGVTVPVTASDDGIVADVLAKEGELIGYGQPILTLQPA
ncbi:acetyl-CoA carboxylase biotin carboxyl carrier protein [Acetobacter pasteurianus 386B]|nr:biotin/lipoyl-containing protein [Acetobacter pasteurianus]CCT59042.1 acetyl-CoA carboxylase biotin carboxyl carrier protein [Acetobacter pasteurianus 386B]